MVKISERDLCHLENSMNIALNDQDNSSRRLAAEAVASAILNGTSGNSLRSQSIAILINENLRSAIPFVDEILCPAPNRCD